MNLPQIMEAIDSGAPLELPGMREHQRAPVVTTLGILLHLLRRYPGYDLGAVPYRAPIDEPAFLQPVISDPTDVAGMVRLDYPLSNKQHGIKSVLDPSEEDWFFALLGGTWRVSTGKGWKTTTRRNMHTVVLPSDDGTLGSEVRYVARAYTEAEQDKRRVSGAKAEPSRIEDHFLWLSSWEKPQSIEATPYPSLIPRRVHLVSTGVVGDKEGTARVAEKTCLEDPHIPLRDSDAAKRSEGDSLSRYTFGCLFGVKKGLKKAKPIRPPSILKLGGYQFVRLCAPGKGEHAATAGYFADLYHLRQTANDDLFDLEKRLQVSELLLELLRSQENMLSHSLQRLLSTSFESKQQQKGEKSDRIKALKAVHVARWKLQVTHKATTIALNHLNSSASEEELRRAVLEVSLRQIQEIYTQAETSVSDVLRKMRARISFEHELNKLKVEPMKTPHPEIAIAITKALRSVAHNLTESDRARLRTMYRPEPSLHFYGILQRVPATLRETEREEAFWRVAIQSLGSIDVLGENLPSVGGLLGRTGFPEMRMERLLNASGTMLESLLVEAIRWIATRGRARADLSELLALGIGRVRRDRELIEWAARRLGTGYVKGSLSKDSNEAA